MIPFVRLQKTVLGLALLVFSLGAATVFAKESFTEELIVKPLADGKLYAHFQFTVRRPDSSLDRLSSHYDLFPRLLGQIISASRVRELHLAFTQGRWQYEQWGYPISAEAGTGVELWAWLESGEKVEQNWKKLTNTLAGLYCGSLNFIDETITVEPRLSYSPEGFFNVLRTNATTNDAQLRRGYLPHENVCTENLTPWIKSLPCQTKAGIATLLNPYKLYDSNFHSMAIHVRPVCEDAACTITSLELTQTLSVVMDPLRKSSKRDWSFQSLFDRVISRDCPVADQSRVSVILDEFAGEGANNRISPEPTRYTTETVEEMTRKLAVYDIKNVSLRDWNIGMTWQEDSFPYKSRSEKPRFYAQQYFTGYGQERGGIRMVLYNNQNEALEAELLHSLPWYLKLYLHTLKVTVRNGTGGDNEDIGVIEQVYYQPALDRGRPGVLEMEIEMPPNSISTISIDFDKVFLKYTEHPPDANRGFDIGPAVITIALPAGKDIIGPGGLEYTRSHQKRQSGQLGLTGYQQRIYTGNLLVALPTPDFSMPYNVITLTCTLMALFLGSMFNLTTREFQPVVVPVVVGKKEEGEKVEDDEEKDGEVGGVEESNEGIDK